MVTMICHIAGLKDPNGDRYRSDGFTGTLLAYAAKRDAIYTNPKGAGIGAIVIFGPGTGEHACLVRRPDHRATNPNPLLYSHGQERGPIFISLSAERQFQPAPVTFLSIANLG